MMSKEGFEITLVMEFEGDDTVSALEYAEDWAYGATDKGDYKIKELGEV